jgi:hypothetical protein
MEVVGYELETLKGIDRSGDLGLEERIILKWILKLQRDGVDWINLFIFVKQYLTMLSVDQAI